MTSENISKLLKRIVSGKLKLNVCELSSNLYNQTILDNDSASPSEIVFAQLVSGFQDINTPVSLKVFIDAKTDNIDHNGDIQGIKYEAQIYKHIINPILVNNFSPNFVGFLGYGECDMSVDITDRVKKSLIKDVSEYKLQKPEKLGILITNKIGASNSTVTNLHEIWSRNLTNRKGKEKILFQVVYSLAVMQQFRLIHNDLHPGNILVEILDEEIERVYVYKHKIYRIKTRYIPYLFDWDLAYCESLGPNPKLEADYRYWCGKINVCNRFSRKFDLYLLLCHIHDINANPVRDAHYETEITVPKDGIERLRKTTPYIGEIYKMGRKQFRDIFGGYASMKLIDRYSGLNSFMFKIKNNTTIILYSGFKCRPTIFTEDMLSADEYLRGKRFASLEVKSIDEVRHIPKKNVYRYPEKSVRPKVYIDPFVPNTHHKIVGKPRFERQSYGSKYVKTKNILDK